MMMELMTLAAPLKQPMQLTQPSERPNEQATNFWGQHTVCVGVVRHGKAKRGARGQRRAASIDLAIELLPRLATSLANCLFSPPLLLLPLLPLLLFLSPFRCFSLAFDAMPSIRRRVAKRTLYKLK